MSDDLLAQVHAALASIPGLNAPEPGAYPVTRLGGLTNLVFRRKRVKMLDGVDGPRLVLRVRRSIERAHAKPG